MVVSFSISQLVLLGFFFCEVTASMSNGKSYFANNLPFMERVFFTIDLL